jgi:hypothetical protein
VSRTYGCRPFEALRGSQTRRDAIRFGLGGTFGLGLADWRRLAAGEPAAGGSDRARSDAPGFGRARTCILIFQWGGPFQAIETRTPGLFVSEHFPLLAQRTDKLTVIRSMSHNDAAHLSTAHRVFTGHLAPVVNSDDIGPSPRDWPHLGSLLAKLRPGRGELPTAVSMPWNVYHPAAPGGRAPGQHGGWLGKSFDPLMIEGDPNEAGFHVPGLGLPEGVPLERVHSRRSLVDSLATIDHTLAPAWDKFQHQAFDTLVSAEARGAFEIEREDPRVRDRYGRHIHGQCLLLARRLVEAGVRLVTVNWHDDGRAFWDTHGNNFNRLKNDLMPPADRGFAALLDDLEARGLLAETLVVWVGEFGRNPKITHANAGREHWPRCYSAAMAGAGVKGGYIHGASDRFAAYPATPPVSPEDLGATMLYALGVDPATMITDQLARPMRINEGEPVRALFG